MADRSDPAEVWHRLVLSQDSVMWVQAAVMAIEQHAEHDEDPAAMWECAAELREVVAAWEVGLDASEEHDA